LERRPSLLDEADMEPIGKSLEIRDARPEDVPALAALLAELGFPAPAAAVARRLDALRDAAEAVLVAARDGQVVGLLTAHVTPVLHRPRPVGRLTALVVTGRARGQGVGRALVGAAERLLAARGCGLVEVTSHRRLTGAHAFYGRLGYTVTSLRFKKSLAPPGRRGVEVERPCG
jgi:GNAT superfamily N-acetyltransferase